MYYPCSENKGADQLRGYREADLRLCFRIRKNPVFSRCGSCHSPPLTGSLNCQPVLIMEMSIFLCPKQTLDKFQKSLIF